MMHDESIQDVDNLQNNLMTFYNDLLTTYQLLNNVTLQALSLMVSFTAHPSNALHFLLQQNTINASLDNQQQLLDDLNMVDDCSTELANVTSQVSTAGVNTYILTLGIGQCFVGTSCTTL